MTAKHISKKEFFTKVADYMNTDGEWQFLGDKPALIDFYASWCGPCKMQGPIVDQLSEERPDVKFCKLNIDEAMPIAMQLGIMSIPTIMVVKKGEITFKEAGLMQKAKLEALL